MPQKTLASPVVCTGISLHAGTQVSMEFKPASADTGIVFHVHAEDGVHLLALRPEAVSTTELATTTISNGKVSVSTIEHVLASLRALDIDNVEIHVVDGKQIIAVTVPAAAWEQRPIFIGGDPIRGTFRRSGEGDYRCTPEVVRSMFREASGGSCDI